MSSKTWQPSMRREAKGGGRIAVTAQHAFASGAAGVC